MTIGPGSLESFHDVHASAMARLATSVGWPHRPTDIELMTGIGCGVVGVDSEASVLGGGFRWDFAGVSRLGLVMVDPRARGKGLGRRIVERLIEDAPPQPIMLLATEQGRPMYDALGFVEIGRIQQHQGHRTGDEAARTRVRQARPADVESMVYVDSEAFGADRGPWITSLIDTSSVVVLDGEAGLDGYGLRREFGRGSVVGPIAARVEQQAIDIFRALPTSGFTRVDSPADATAFNAHIRASGLEPAGEASPVMIRGSLPTTERSHMMFALSGHALG